MGKDENRKLKINTVKFVRNIIIAVVALIIAAAIFIIAPNYTKDQDDGKTHLIINNKNLTSNDRLSNDLVVENGIVYLSKEDITRFFDKYLYYEKQYNRYITTTSTKVASIMVGEYKIEVNGVSTPIAGTVIEKNGTVYLPFSEMKDIYNVDVQNIEETNIVLIDSLDREQTKAEVTKNLSIKLKAKTLSRTLEKIKKGDQVVVISKLQSGWSKVRTVDGIIGYVKTDKLQNETKVRENMEEEKQISGEKISMVWDYYSESRPAPTRTGTTIKAVNVVAPSFFALKTLENGEIRDKAQEAGKKYIEWAKGNNYKVWAIFSNESLIETTSVILNDYKKRQQTIENIVNLAVKYGVDGINLDF